MQRDIRCVRVERTFDNKHYKKVCFNIREETLSDRCFLMLCDLIRLEPGVRCLPPQAPAGDLERQLQEFLETNGESKKSEFTDNAFNAVDLQGVDLGF